MKRQSIIIPSMMKSLFLISCAPTFQQNFPSDLKERANLEFEYDKKTYVGTAVLQRKSYHNFRFKVPKETRELVISTCHRSHSSNDASYDNLFKIEKLVAKYAYIPVAFLENWDSCFLVASAHIEDGTRKFALIDFTSNEAINADVYCNGEKLSGTANMCQASEGTEQMIVFDKTVQARSGSCDVPVTERGVEFGSRFYLKVQKGYCLYIFNDGFETNRLTVYGY